MALYINQTGKLSEVKEKPFKLEKDIQKVFEANLSDIMGLELVKSEFSIKNKRIDTLAYDAQACAFIIIEYKRDKNISVVDQGFTYLSLMLENKADFIVEYNESLKRNLKRENVDWSQTRVAFVSPSFTENQKQATNFKDIAIELWEIKQYENDTLAINPIKKTVSAESIKPITQQTQSLKSVTAEIKVYTEQDHIEKASDLTAELYEKFKNAITNLSDNIEVIPLKYWLNFDKGNLTLASIEIQKKKLNLTINKKAGNLDDSKNITRDISKIGHYGKGDYQVQVEDDKDLEYIMSLIKQAIPQ
jgi:predicted transport protein